MAKTRLTTTSGRRRAWRAVAPAWFGALTAAVHLNVAAAEKRTYNGPRAVASETTTPTTNDGKRSAAPREPVRADRGPPPGHATGVAVAERAGTKRLLWVPRVILFVPRWALDIAIHPARLAILILEEYKLEQIYYRIFWNDARTFGVYPVGIFETGFGTSIGGRLVHKDLFGHREYLRLRASWGPDFGQRYRLRFHTGRAVRFGRLRIRADFRDHPNDVFYGIGNHDEAKPSEVEPPLDPTRANVAVRTALRQISTRAGAALDLPLPGPLSFSVGQLWSWRTFARAPEIDDEPPLDEIWDTSKLVGHDNGVSNVYTEFALELDNRRWARHVSPAAPSSGWYGRLWAGHAVGVGHDPSSYARFGGDIQRFVDLFRGDRVLKLRLYAEQLAAPLRRIPFTDLPALGGHLTLRGYPRARFRDRFALAGTVEYMYPIDERFSGFFFADPGGVWPSIRDINYAEARLGFGGGFQFHNDTRFWARLLLASSMDGGFFVRFAINPPNQRRQNI